MGRAPGLAQGEPLNAMSDATHDSHGSYNRGFEQDDSIAWIVVVPISMIITLGMVIYLATLG